MKNSSFSKFRQLIDITAVDYPEQSQRFKLIYLLLSHEHNSRIILSYSINEKEIIQSVTKFSHLQIGWKEKYLICMELNLMVIQILEEF